MELNLVRLDTFQVTLGQMQHKFTTSLNQELLFSQNIFQMRKADTRTQ